MIPSFNFSRIPDIIFGDGAVQQLTACLKKYGVNIVLVHGKSFTDRNYGLKLLELLHDEEFNLITVVVEKEPSPHLIDIAVKELRDKNISAVVAIGGGSVLDAGKAISAMLKEDGTVVDFLEGVGYKTPSGDKVPFVAIPTTAGTGSEMTKNAVITQDGKNAFKKSLRHTNYVPDVAIVDPGLTLSCPPNITAASGLDAFSQLLESYLSTSASPMTDALALQGMALLMKSLLPVHHNGENIEARADVAYAAMLSGITLANAGLGTVHGFAQPLGSLFSLPHGNVCGSLFVATNRLTIERIKNNKKYAIPFDKYAALGKYLLNPTVTNKQAVALFIETIANFAQELNIPGLSTFGITEEDFDLIIAQTGNKKHPYPFTPNDLRIILKESL